MRHLLEKYCVGQPPEPALSAAEGAVRRAKLDFPGIDKRGDKLTTTSYSCTSQSIASSRVLNTGSSRCEKLLKCS